MEIIHHRLQEEDREPLAKMREAAAPTKGQLGPDARVPFDSMMEQTPAAAGVTYAAGNVGSVWGYWCRPADAQAGAAVLYLHGGAYVVGSAQAYRHFAGQIAVRAEAAIFVAEYRLAPAHPFPGAADDAAAAYSGSRFSAGRLRRDAERGGGHVSVDGFIAQRRKPGHSCRSRSGADKSCACGHGSSVFRLARSA